MNKRPAYRICKKCGQARSLADFHIYNKQTGARRYECISCYRIRQNAQYVKDPEVKKRASARRYAAKPFHAWDEATKERQRAQHRQHRAAHIQMVLDQYGRRCTCCGETERMFLTVDHINGDGADHRRAIKASRSPDSLYRWIIKHGFPDDFQLLCFNCNCGRYRNGGVCPHQVTEGSTTIPQGSRAKRPEAPSIPKGMMI